MCVFLMCFLFHSRFLYPHLYLWPFQGFFFLIKERNRTSFPLLIRVPATVLAHMRKPFQKKSSPAYITDKHLEYIDQLTTTNWKKGISYNMFLSLCRKSTSFQSIMNYNATLEILPDFACFFQLQCPNDWFILPLYHNYAFVWYPCVSYKSFADGPKATEQTVLHTSSSHHHFMENVPLTTRHSKFPTNF